MTQLPYKLPEGWRWVRLGEACEINPRRPRLHVDPNEPTTFVPMTAVDDQAGTIVTPEVRPFEQVRQGYTYFEEGDVLFAKITPCMENGKAAIACGLLNGFGFGSTEFHVLRPGGSVIPEWIWLFIRQERFRKAAKASFRGGVGQQRVPKEFLEYHPIPLPPLPEQRRIVARVEALMSRIREARRLREQAREDAERLVQAALAETFPRPGAELPPGWRWVRLGEVVHLINGRSYRKTDWATEGVPIIRIQNLNNPGKPFNYWNGSLDGHVLVPPGTVLISWSGTPGTSFGAHIWDRDHGVLNQHIFRVDFKIEDVLPNYFACAVNTQLDILIGGAIGGVGLRHITKKQVEGLAIPLPPLEEQRRIVARLEAVQERVKALKEAQAATDAELKRLEQAILDRAFKGEL